MTARMDVWLAVAAMAALALQGCSSGRSQAEPPTDTDSLLRGLCEKGDYHAAMRKLPQAMAEWEAYTVRTGETYEGAAGYLYATTMTRIADVGEADWGKILDDPDIPYGYKTEMIFEILEARLGKGAVYVGNKKNFIVPRSDPIDLDKEMIRLPD